MRHILKTIFILTISFLFLHESVAASGFHNAIPTTDTLPIAGSTESVKIFDKVEIEASVNRDAWINHLQKVLLPIVNKASRKGMPKGTYTVMVRYLVETNGSIADVVALNDPGFGLAEGAIKAIRTGPKWNPGEQGGRKVRSYHTQPVTFVISD